MKKTTLSIVVVCFISGFLLMSFTSNFPSENSLSAADDGLRPPKTDSVIGNSGAAFSNEMDLAVPKAGNDLIADLQNRINYPQKAIDKNIEGTVVIIFTVNTKGNVENVKLVKDIGGNCGEEACRAARTMKFKPATQNGHAMKQDFYVPVVFSLNKLN